MTATWDIRGPELHSSARHLLKSFFFSPSEVEVPLDHGPYVLGLLVCELRKVQLFPHLCASSRPHLKSHGITTSQCQEAPGTAKKSQSMGQIIKTPMDPQRCLCTGTNGFLIGYIPGRGLGPFNKFCTVKYMEISRCVRELVLVPGA